MGLFWSAIESFVTGYSAGSAVDNLIGVLIGVIRVSKYSFVHSILVKTL